MIRFIKTTIKVILLVGIMAFLGGAAYYMEPHIKEVERLVKVYGPDPRPTAQLIEELSDKHGVPRYVTHAIIVQESGESMRPDRMRYEAHLLRKFKRANWMNDAEHKAYATSYGLMQVVYGLHKQRCGLNSYADLLDRETNIDCGLAVLSDCLKRSKATTKSAKLHNALHCYNGSKKYADEVMQRIAGLIINATWEG